MLSQDDLQSAIKLQQQTNEFLEKHELAPTPMNYTVVYSCLSKKILKLTHAVSDQLSEKGYIDAVFLEDAFHQFISDNDNAENELFSPLDSLIETTMHTISGQIDNQQQLMDSLETVDRNLSPEISLQSLKTMVGFLTDEVKKSKAKTAQLTEDLANASEEVKQLQNKLEQTRKEATTDPLTGLLNRRGCTNKLNFLDPKSVHSSLVIDIDHFKFINDNFGHYIGDKVLQRVAKEIKKQIADVDFAVRFGGEEFLVLLVNKTLEEATPIAQNIRDGISKLKLVQKNSSKTLPPITVSIGASQITEKEDWTSLFNRADSALYHAKNTGRNKVVISTVDNGAPQLSDA